MKVLRENPLTKNLHEFWRAEILTNLGFESSFLFPIKYVRSVPHSLYSRKAFKAYLGFLENASSSDSKLLFNVINNLESAVGRANALINEVNEKLIHDVHPPDGIELLNFINSEIHYNLLNLYESGLAVLLSIAATFNRLKRNKGIDGLDLYNMVTELDGTELSFVADLYHATIRNGIAHGKVAFAEWNIQYSDKKGNTEEMQPRDVIRLFDRLLDALNGFSLGLKVFILSRQADIGIPLSIVNEELQIACKTPGWSIVSCFESSTIDNKRQLTVYVRNRNWDSGKVNWYSFFTAYWAEALTEDYERIFISLNSSPSLPGWAAFDARKLRELRLSDSQNLLLYRETLEEGGIQFVPKYKFPRLVYKLGTYRNALLVSWDLQRQKQRKSQRHLIEVRDVDFHFKNANLVIPDSSVIISSDSPVESLTLIRKKHSQIVRKVIIHTRNQMQALSYRRFYPAKYIRVFIYDSNERIRNLRHSGLTKELIATIQVNVSKEIKVPDLINSEIEQFGKYRIFWNKNWRNYGLRETNEQKQH